MHIYNLCDISVTDTILQFRIDYQVLDFLYNNNVPKELQAVFSFGGYSNYQRKDAETLYNDLLSMVLS